MVSEEQWRYHPRYEDRPRGVLTQREREYLLGESDIEPKSDEERSVRQDIRQHTIDSILDFRILRKHLEERDRDQIFSPTVEVDTDPQEFYRKTSLSEAERPPDELGEIDPGFVKGTATDMISFVFQQVDNEHMFARKVENAISDAAISMGYDADVDVEIQLDIRANVDETLERFEEHGVEAVTSRELRTLRDAGEIEEMEYHELALEREKLVMDGSARRRMRESAEESLDDDGGALDDLAKALSTNEESIEEELDDGDEASK